MTGNFSPQAGKVCRLCNGPVERMQGFGNVCFECSCKRAREDPFCPTGCVDNAVYITWEGPIGHGWKCGTCGTLLQVG